MSEPTEPAIPEALEVPVDDTPRYLIGVRLREPLLTEDYQTTDPDLHVGDFVLVETGGGSVPGEVRRPKRPVPSFKLDRVYRRVVRRATAREVADWRERRGLEVKGVETCARTARARGLAMKIVDVEMDASRRRVTVFFNSEERVDFRDLVRDLAREFHARIEMRQIGARDTTKLLDGIGPCGRQLCCSSHLRKFDPISVKMAKAQDMPLTDSRLLGNCGRLKCCLLYEFSTYEALRSRLPRVNTPCSASCGGGGCMTGKVRSLRVLKQSVVVGFPDGTEAEVPLDQLTWEGRDHIKPA
ncbi:MAG: stage 0 sporulation family protein [Candidatus Rokuibacteriota bacterium]|jgi:cell fate regulator YaaT (PSP1 superfamily)